MATSLSCSLAGAINRLILVHGPNGSAKSTLVGCLCNGAEHYSRLPEGERARCGGRVVERLQHLERLIREYSAKMPVKVELTHADRVRFVNNLVGLTMLEAEKVITKLIVEDGILSERDVQRVKSIHSNPPVVGLNTLPTNELDRA